MSYMKCENCESWERCVECGWCVFCAESEKAKLLSEIERLRLVEDVAKDILNYFTKYPALLPKAQYDALKAALEGK